MMPWQFSPDFRESVNAMHFLIPRNRQLFSDPSTILESSPPAPEFDLASDLYNAAWTVPWPRCDRRFRTATKMSRI
jgi:hypothetical protein